MSERAPGGWEPPAVGLTTPPPPPPPPPPPQTTTPAPPLPPPDAPAPAATPPVAPWYPPGPGTSWEPQPGEPIPATDVQLDSALLPKRSKARLIGGVAGAGALLAAGTFAVVSLRDDGAGGAESPEAAVESFVGALNDEDVLGALEVLLPAERDAFEDAMVRFVEELQRLEALDESADLGSVEGLDIQIDLASVTTEPVADDIVTVDVAGTATVVVDQERLPIGDLILDYAFEGDRPTGGGGDESSFDTQGSPVRIATVERDGQWYMSVMYSVAESARVAADAGPVPAGDQAVEPQGGSSPEEAMDQFLDAVVALDLERMIASLNPNEAEALQRYAPLFLPDAQAAVGEMVAEAGLSITIDDVGYDVEVDGDQATIVPVSFSARAEVEGDVTSISYADGCVTVEVGGIEEQTCEDDTGDTLGPFGAGGLADVMSGSGVRLDRVDGEWYVSVLGTAFDTVLASFESLDRADIDELFEGMQDGSIDPFEELPDVVEPVEPVEPASTVPVPDVTGDTVPTEDEATNETFPDDPTIECYIEEDPAAALECLLAAQAVDPEVYISPAMRFPECGIAGYSWRYAWDELDDEVFIETVTAANECFSQKVATGELEDWEIPTEVLDPSCYNGTNPYRIDDLDEQSAALSAYYDCAFA